MKRELILALDRSARRIDADGQLHVTLTNISKANICPYYGSEIPGAESLGLDPTRIYYLFRDPAELERSAPTFNGKQLMFGHVGVSAEEPNHERIAGAVGTDTIFEAPYLKASISVWDADVIAKILSGEVKAISCGYRYDPDMTSGTYEGLHYDGIMRNISANHVALVAEGRAGPEIVVTDEQIKGRSPMLRSRMALMARGAVAAYLRPLLTVDAKIDLNAAFADVNGANFQTMKPVIIGRITNEARGQLVTDASLAGLSLALDAMEDDTDADDADMDDDEERARVEREARDRKKRARDRKMRRAADAKRRMGRDETAEEKDARERREDAEDARRAMDARTRLGRDETAAECREREDAEDESDMSAAQDNPPAFQGRPNDPAEDRRAMDAAIQQGVRDGLALARAYDHALAEVSPVVGEVHGCTTAESVYKFALDSAHVDTKGVHPSAFQALFRMHAKTLANDAAPLIAVDALDNDFYRDFPDAKRFG